MIVAFSSLFLCSVAIGQVVDLPDGRVEFVGLRHWSIERVQAALEERAPGASLHHCAAALKELGFPDAAVMNYFEEGARYTVVSVVEPEGADRVRFRAPIAGASVPVEAWATAERLRKDHGIEYGAALSRWLAVKAQGEVAVLEELARGGLDQDILREVWAFLQERSAEEDFQQAVWVLAHDANEQNRATAVALLLNFLDRDLAMWSLLEAARDPAQPVRDACLSALWGVSRFLQRDVDWSPAAASLRALVGGTNLFAFPEILRILATTGVAPSLADELLAQNSHLVLAYLGASHKREHDIAHAFLSRLHGGDLGRAPNAWRAWIESLEQ